MARIKTGVEEAPVPIASGGPHNRLALNAQSNIGGWGTLLGRISKQMSEKQARRYQSKKSKRTGLRWTVAIIKKLQDIAWDMWEHRNAVLHKDPDKHHRKIALEEANAEIEREWTRGDQGLLIQDRFLFRCKEEIVKRTLERKRIWLESITGARRAADARAETSSARQEQLGHARKTLVWRNLAIY